MYKIFLTLVVLVAFGNAIAQPAAGTSALDWAKKKCTDIGFKAGTERFGNCVLQLSRNDEAVGVVNPKPVVVTPTQLPKQESQKELTTFKDCEECPEMVVIPAGKFLMGSKDDPFARMPPEKSEFPIHEVSIRSFAIGKFEITQEQWFFVMKTMPSAIKDRLSPVTFVSWDDAKSFTQKLSQMTGKKYRLPFEAEWEFAARAGTNSVFSFGDEVTELAKYAWYAMNSEKNYATQVGRKLPNGFGLYDMHGNASEWVQNCITENYSNQNDALNPQENCSARVVRGGSWAVQAPSLRSANRSSYSQTGGLSSISFRVARDN